MTQILANRLQANVMDLRPDLFPLFRETVAKIDDADARECDVERRIGYATADAILDAAVNIVPMDIENILHRIGCAHHLLDTVYDRACCGFEIDDVINQIAGLLQGTAKGLADAYNIDMQAARLDFYLPQPDDQN